MRSIWSGFLSFGSILIPIRSYAASSNLHISFHQVHKTDCGRVRYKKVCEKDGEELKPDDIIKAYIVGGECLKFTDEESEVNYLNYISQMQNQVFQNSKMSLLQLQLKRLKL